MVELWSGTHQNWRKSSDGISCRVLGISSLFSSVHSFGQYLIILTPGPSRHTFVFLHPIPILCDAYSIFFSWLHDPMISQWHSLWLCRLIVQYAKFGVLKMTSGVPKIFGGKAELSCKWQTYFTSSSSIHSCHPSQLLTSKYIPWTSTFLLALR